MGPLLVLLTAPDLGTNCPQGIVAYLATGCLLMQVERVKQANQSSMEVDNLLNQCENIFD